MNWRAHPRLAAAATCAIVVSTLFLVWDWNWFRPLVEARASAAVGREVEIGRLGLRLLSRHPRATFEDVTISNPPGFGETEALATIKRLSVSFDIGAALHGSLRIPEIVVDAPRGDLRSNAEGMRNWDLGGEPGPSGAEPGEAPPEIGNLIVRDGRIRFSDPKLGADFTTLIRTETAPDTEPTLIIEAKGTYHAQPIEVHFRGGSLLSLRDPAKPYPLDLQARNGATRIALSGTVADPLKLGGARLQLALEGKDLADLRPLIGIPLASSPPFRLKGRLDYGNRKIRFDDFAGTVGQSDLSGTFAVDPGQERPRITADLTSHRVVMADLGGFIGAAPGKDDQANLSAQQKAEHARERENPKLLPDKPFNIPSIRAADFHVRYVGGHIEGKSMPLDNLVTTLTIENGKITLAPLNFGVGRGTIASNIELDARQTPIHAKAEVDFRRVDLHRIMQSTQIFQGAGTIGGRAFLDTSGNSVSDMLARGNGALKLFMAGGDVSALLVDLAGLDLGNSILSALGLPQRTDIRCMVSDFALRNGALETRMLFLDTTEANITGKGAINLRDETIDYQIGTEPKHFSVGALPAPIDITGRLKTPSIGPDPAALAARAGPSAALGILLTPLAALLPTIQLGLGKDSDCSRSVARVERESKALPGPRPKTPRRAK